MDTPAIVIGCKGYFDIFEEPVVSRNMSLYEVTTNRVVGAVIYDNNGDKWTIKSVTPSRRHNVLQKVLSYFLYNPTVQVTFDLEAAGKYEFKELRDLLMTCVKEHPDVFMVELSFEEFDDRAGECRSVPDIISVLKRGMGQT